MKLIRCRQRWLGRDSSQTLSCIKLSSYDIPWSGYGQFLKSFLEEKFDSEIEFESDLRCIRGRLHSQGE